MIKLRDHYFIAWLVVNKNIQYKISDSSDIMVDINSQEYTEFKTEYEMTDKPLLVKIRKVVKELNRLRS